MTLAAVARLSDSDHKLLVFGEAISERSATAFRAAGIDYVDAGGNAHLAFGDVYIDVRGREQAPVESETPAPNLFSAGRLKVVFVLLTWPDLAGSTVREISRAAGTSIGLTQSALQGMEADGYLSRSTLERRDTLLTLWTAAYRGTLLPKLTLASFTGDVPTALQYVQKDADVLISGEAAVGDIAHPETLTFYTRALDPRMPIRWRWRTDREPNIWVRQRFWTEPASITPIRSYDSGSVPPLLIYGDLLSSNEPRQIEVAAALQERHEL